MTSLHLAELSRHFRKKKKKTEVNIHRSSDPLALCPAAPLSNGWLLSVNSSSHFCLLCLPHVDPWRASQANNKLQIANKVPTKTNLKNLPHSFHCTCQNEPLISINMSSG